MDDDENEDNPELDRDPAPAPGLSWEVHVHSKKRWACWVFKCARCERAQAYAQAAYRGGIDEPEARRIGWKSVRGLWVCPWCDPRQREDY